MLKVRILLPEPNFFVGAKVLRHSREMVRYQRERIIKKRYNRWWMKRVYDAAEKGIGVYYPNPVSYGPPWTHKGYLNKLSMHHHRCSWCVQKYERAKVKKRQPIEIPEEESIGGWQPCGYCYNECDCQWNLDIKGHVVPADL